MNYTFTRRASGMVFCAIVLAATAYAQDTYEPPPSSGLWRQVFGFVLSALAGAAVGAFFSDRFRKFRRYLFLLLIAVAVIAQAAVFMRGPILRDVMAFVAAAAGTWYLLRDRIKAFRRPPGERDTTLGSAEWATLQHLETLPSLGEEGFVLGTFAEDSVRTQLRYKGDRHLLTVAPTRSGKGVAAIVPNLLTYTGSALIIDPKGENARMTAGRRGPGIPKLNIPGLKQSVYIVDPWKISGFAPARFNPLDWITSDPTNCSENAMMLADSMIPPARGKADPFWDEEAKALLMGFILHVAFDPAEEGQRTLGRVRDIIVAGTKDLALVLATMEESSLGIVRSTAARTISKDEKLRAGVFASLQSHTHFLDSPAMRESLSASDFKFEDLKAKPMTVYLVLPADRLETFGRWLRLLIQQAITVNARNIELKPAKPILFMLDEMAALGRLTMVEQAFGLMAGFGMQLWGIVQDFSQLERIYGPGWQTFIGNSGVLQYFGSRDLKTAEYFSKLCGVTTQVKFSFSSAVARAFSRSHTSGSSTGPGGGNSSSSSTYTTGTTTTEGTTRDVVQRHLAYPDELMVLKGARQLLFIENSNPIRAERTSWHEDKDLQKLGVNLQSIQKPGTRPAAAPTPVRAPSQPQPSPVTVVSAIRP